MQRQTSSAVQDEGGYRSLDAGAVFVHNAHLSSGQPKVKHCRMCLSGLGGVLKAVETDGPVGDTDEKLEGDGADQERDTTLPLGGGSGAF